MRLPAKLTEVSKLRNLQSGEEIEITVPLLSTAADLRELVASKYMVASPSQIALLNGLIVLDDVAIIADIQPGPPFIGFTINSPSMGEFLRLIYAEQNAELDDEQRFGAVEAAILREITEEEQEQIDRLRGTKIRLSLAVAIFVQANRNFDAVPANADLFDQ
jgi:hypothetical protein